MYDRASLLAPLNYLLAALVVLTLCMMGLFGRRNHFVVAGRTALVTGGSQGMGKSLAKSLAKKGANVVIVARDTNKLASALEELQSCALNPSSQRFHYISADLADANENVRVVREVTAWNKMKPPDVVWANAGSAYPHLFLETDVDTLRRQMDINYWAAAYLAHATLKEWTRPSQEGNRVSLPRHFVITSSVIAYCGLAGYAPYSPPKSALRSLADTLQSETQLYNGARFAPCSSTSSNPEIKIHIVLPGTILSPGHAQEQKLKHPVTKMLETGDPAQTEDEVADAAIKGLENGGYMVTTQFLGHLMRAGMIGGSPRNGIGVGDTVLSWITSVVWLFVGPDLERKVRKWGTKHGTGDVTSDAQK